MKLYTDFEVVEYNEDPVVCLACGARTDFIQINSELQLHQCLGCDDVFLAQEETD